MIGWANVPIKSTFIEGLAVNFGVIALNFYFGVKLECPPFIDSKIAPIVSQVNTPSAVESIDNTLSLAPADFIANEIMTEAENPATAENNFNFVNLPEQSKISAVVLESNGLTTLELEDGFFEDLGI